MAGCGCRERHRNDGGTVTAGRPYLACRQREAAIANQGGRSPRDSRQTPWLQIGTNVARPRRRPRRSVLSGPAPSRAATGPDMPTPASRTPPSGISWTQNEANCTSSYSLAALWVGLDGFSDGTVEQTA
jgi:hypothetical protein